MDIFGFFESELPEVWSRRFKINKVETIESWQFIELIQDPNAYMSGYLVRALNADINIGLGGISAANPGSEYKDLIDGQIQIFPRYSYKVGFQGGFGIMFESHEWSIPAALF
jgi:hypothetical protein